MTVIPSTIEDLFRITFVAPQPGVAIQGDLEMQPFGGCGFEKTGVSIQVYEEGGQVKNRVVVSADNFTLPPD